MKKGKWIVLALCAVFLLSAFLIDKNKAKKYDFELLSAADMKFIADGESTKRISVKLTMDGKPVKGHTVYIYASNGTLPASRCVTDEDGTITFKYYPYVYLNDELTPLEDVTIYLQDESNSSIFMVPAKGQFTFGVVKPESADVNRDWQHLGEGEE